MALAQKVIDRVTAAGLPADRIPVEMASVSVIAGGDAENALRAIVLQFMEDVRLAEQAIAAARAGSPEAGGPVTVGDWRAHWPERVYYDSSGLPRSVVHWPEQESS